MPSKKAFKDLGFYTGIAALAFAFTCAANYLDKNPASATVASPTAAHVAQKPVPPK